MSTQAELFRYGQFAVTPKGLKVDRGSHPGVEDWAEALSRVSRVRSGVQWAVGDLLLYADAQGYDDGLVEAAAEATGLKRGTLYNLKSVAKAFPAGQRSSLSWSHHALVAGFSEEERGDLLRRAARENLSWDDLRALTKDLRHAQRFAAQAWPAGTFGVQLSDPAWQHEDGALPPSRATENHYPTMPTDQIMALAPQVQAITAPSCVHFMWATSAKVVSGEAQDVLRAWGFAGRAMHVWVKDHMGLGYWVRNRHEHLLIAVRGNPVPPSEHLRADSVLTSARGEHSEKPVEAYEVIERCYPGVPRVELFARPPFRDGWAHWGNEETGDAAAGRGVRIRESLADGVPA